MNFEKKVSNSLNFLKVSVNIIIEIYLLFCKKKSTLIKMSGKE